MFYIFKVVIVFVIGLIISLASAAFQQLPDCNAKPTPPAEGENQSTVYRDSVVISTLDGRVSLLNNGKLQWSIETGSEELLSSSITRLEMSSNGQVVRLVPSLDGSLYKFNGESLEPLPMSAESLLQTSFHLGDDTIITGGKEVTSYGISLQMGQVRYVCSMKGCSNSEGEPSEDVVVVKRLTQTVRAVDPRSGSERWNFSVGEHQLLILKGIHDGCGHHDESNDSVHDDEENRMQFVVPEGYITVSDGNSKKPRWSYQFDSPIVNAWRVRDGKAEAIDLFDEHHIGISAAGPPPLLYIGVHHKQLYVQNSALMKTAIADSGKSSPKLDWKPYLATSDSRTPYLNIGREQPNLITDSAEKASTALVLKHDDYFDYPFDSGYYLYGNLVFLENDTICEKEVEETFDYIVIASLWHWWKEVLAISIVMSVAVNFLITRHVLKRLKKKLIQESSGSEIQIIQKSEEPEAAEAVSEEREKQVPAPVSTSDESEYRSRYVIDFEPIQCLGKGGFGVVFESKNKIDDCHYAVKRISLPSGQDAREKVMREVKALAKLDHTGIVRYFNAWQECPPVAWQEHMDKQWGCSENPSPGFSLVTKASSQWKPEKPNNNPMKVGESKNSFGFVFPNIESDQESGSFSCEKSRLFQYSDSFDIVFASGDGAKPPNETGSFVQFEDSGCDDRSSDMKQEDDDWGKGDRPNVLPLQDKILTSPRLYLYIQMQLCRKETLKDWLSANNEHNREDVLDIFDQIVGAVQYVHDCGLMHRDLKPSNILFSIDWTVKVGDFGLVTATTETEAHTPQDSSIGRHTNQVGTQLYMSPEQIAGQAYNNKVDIFSLGLILFELLHAFPTQMERVKIMLNVKNGHFPASFSASHPEECLLVKKLLSQESGERPSAGDIRQDSLFKDFQPNPQMSARFRRRRTISERFSSGSDSQD